MSWEDDEIEMIDEDALAAPSYSGNSILGHNDEAEDWSPMIAVPPSESPDEDPDESAADWTPDKGFPDPTNSVRVWGNRDGELEKIRFSLSWRTKLGDRPLGEAVTTAFMLMNNYWHAYSSPVDYAAGLREPTRHATPQRIQQIVQRLDDLRGELDTLDPIEFPGFRQTWEPAAGSDFENGVSVHLDSTGRPALARFDPKWLKTANSRELSVGIMSSYRKARASYRPPHTVLDRRGELLKEQERLLLELRGPSGPALRDVTTQLKTKLPPLPGALGRGSASSTPWRR